METQLRIAVEFGYPLLQVKRVLQQKQFPSAGDLVAFLFDAPLFESTEEEIISSTTLKEEKPLHSHTKEEKETMIPATREEDVPECLQSFEELKIETMALLYLTKCLHCHERDRNVVTLPCSHLTLCMACAPLVKLCPKKECNEPIEVTLLTYML